MNADNRPLCVDLDGTLIKTDLLVESLFGLLRKKPWSVFVLPLWLLRGKAYLKERIACEVDVGAALVPYHDALLVRLREIRASGRSLVLATASHRKFANGVAAHLCVFDEVLATEGGHKYVRRGKGGGARQAIREWRFWLRG